MPRLSRRSLLKLSGAGTAGLLAPRVQAGTGPIAQEISSGKLLNRFPRMVQEYFVDQVRRIEQSSLKRKNSLRTRSQAESYVRAVRRGIQQCLGPFPERTPLNARITGIVERGEYRIEKVIFESRPGFAVTGNLYLPGNRRTPLPAVVATCGHSDTGKAGDTYQSFVQGLAKMGYVVFIFDPISQGERLQYPDANLRSTVGAGVNEHLLTGNQQILVGENLPAWRAWDGIRALDYLLTRPEVDRNHIGLTGNSGGGTMTTWLCGLDQRWTMAAPGCFVTTFRRNLENELPQDAEQYPPKALALGLDHDDFLAAMAPRPVIILAKELDYFDARGAEESYARLKRLYRLLGVEERIQLFIGPTYHGYSQENREAMYKFFNRVTGVSNAQTEPPIALEKEEALWCTPRGQVSTIESRTVFSFTGERSKKLATSRKPLTGAALRDTVIEVLKIPAAGEVPDARILRRISRPGYPMKEFTAYAVETEPGIQALVYRLSDERHYSRPSGDRKRAVLYVSHHSSDAELRAESLVRDLIRDEPEAAFFTCDVRGIGESQPDTCGEDQFLRPYGSDYFYAGHSIMLDRPYVGRKTFDLLRVIAWLKSYGHSEVHLAGKGWGAIPAAFAALLSDEVRQATLKQAPVSYAVIAESERYNWPLSTLVPGILQNFDLPDCYRELEARKLRLIDPQGPMADWS